ncbi:heme-binding domain-containing protein [soil metagenome]
MARDDRRRILKRAAVVVLALFLAIQAVPYGWWHENPPVVAAAQWPDPEAEAIARAACYDCHSNESRWPFYSYVAPMSWLVRRDVEQGREELSFSDWDAGEADDAIDSIEEGKIPPWTYTMIHRDAAMSPEEMAIVIDALRLMEAAD